MSYNFRLSFGAAFFIDFSSLISTERNWWGNLFPFALRILHHLLYGFIGYEENNAIFVKIGIKIINHMKQYIEKNRERFLEELFSLLRIPSVSSLEEHRPDMKRFFLKPAQILHQSIRQRGIRWYSEKRLSTRH